MRLTARALDALQSWSAHPELEPATLVVLTSGAVAVDGASTAPTRQPRRCGAWSAPLSRRTRTALCWWTSTDLAFPGDARRARPPASHSWPYGPGEARAPRLARCTGDTPRSRRTPLLWHLDVTERGTWPT
ncbi:hypothetical protein LV779_19000 [Streptomyces thinghirensis]|nr:hypothetical protein [Streptomyces thinghirensis]